MLFFLLPLLLFPHFHSTVPVIPMRNHIIMIDDIKTLAVLLATCSVATSRRPFSHSNPTSYMTLRRMNPIVKLFERNFRDPRVPVKKRVRCKKNEPTRPAAREIEIAIVNLDGSLVPSGHNDLNMIISHRI